jgi:hypothetical protein
MHIWFKLTFTGAALLLWLSADAQCAMCRAVAEDSMYDESYGYAMGLNSGIIMLMLIPYILLTSLFMLFFRKQIAGFFRSFNNIH